MIWLIIELLTTGISEELLIEFLIEKFLAKSSFLRLLLRNVFKSGYGKGYKAGYQRGYKTAKEASKNRAVDLFKIIEMLQGRGLEKIVKNSLKLNKTNLFKEGRRVNNKWSVNNLVWEQFNKEARDIFGKTDIGPVANARKEFLKTRAKIDKGEMRGPDTAFLSSSWCYKGIWIAEGGRALGKSYIGTLLLTVKKETWKKGKLVSVVIGKTYTYYGVSLSCWELMKQALGRDGTGAGTAFWYNYLKGWRGEGPARAFQWSEQVLISRNKWYGK